MLTTRAQLQCRNSGFRLTSVNQNMLWKSTFPFSPQCHAWDSGAAAWSTVGLTTGEISSDGGVSFIQCSNDALGFIAIFLVEIEATTPTPNVTTAPPVEETPAFVQLSLDAEYANFVNESTKADFIADVKEGIANELGVNESRITELTVAPGSIIVTFKLLPGGAGDKNISTLVALLQSKVQSGGLNITLGDGRTLTADPNSFVLHGATLPPPTTAAPTTTQPPSTATDAPKPSTGPSGLSQTMLIVIIVVSCVVGIVIIVVIVLCVRAKNRRSKIEASSAEDPTPPPERGERLLSLCQLAITKTSGNLGSESATRRHLGSFGGTGQAKLPSNKRPYFVPWCLPVRGKTGQRCCAPREHKKRDWRFLKAFYVQDTICVRHKHCASSKTSQHFGNMITSGMLPPQCVLVLPGLNIGNHFISGDLGL